MDGYGAPILDALRDADASDDLRRVAGRLGLRVHTVAEGADLLRILKDPAAAPEGTLDAVFVALKYPETDVFEILRLVRARSDADRIAVYLAAPETQITSGAPARTPYSPTDPDYLEMAAMQGVSAVLPLPFDDARLMALLSPATVRPMRRAR